MRQRDTQNYTSLALLLAATAVLLAATALTLASHSVQSNALNTQDFQKAVNSGALTIER